MWSVAPKSIIQACDRDYVRQDIRVAFWARVAEKDEDWAYMFYCSWNNWNCSNSYCNCSSEKVAKICAPRWFSLQKGALIFSMTWLFTVVTIDHRVISSSSSRTSSPASVPPRPPMWPPHFSICLPWASKVNRSEIVVVVSGDCMNNILRKVICLQ